MLQVHGKGKRQRSLPIAPGMDSLLEDYLASRAARHGAAVLRVRGNPLLVHYDGSALTRGRIQYVIERLYERAAIRGAVPPGALVHALRHSFATLAIDHGTNVAELQRLMGPRNPGNDRPVPQCIQRADQGSDRRAPVTARHRRCRARPSDLGRLVVELCGKCRRGRDDPARREPWREVLRGRRAQAAAQRLTRGPATPASTAGAVRRR